MLAVALAARQQVTHRLDRAHEMTVSLAARFRRAFHAEAALGVVVLAFSGWLLQLTPPNVDPLANETYLDEIPVVHQASGLDASIFIGPGRAGPTGLRVEVNAPETGISRLTLRFIPPVTATGAFIVEQEIPLTGAGTAVLDDSVGLPLNVPGTWTLQVSAATTSGVMEPAERTFGLTDANGDFVTVPSVDQTRTSVEVEEVDQSTTTAPFATTTPPTDPPTAEHTTTEQTTTESDG
jgi:hypothetical protein